MKGSSRSQLLSPEEVSRAQTTIQSLLGGLGKAILGQEELLERVVTCLLARGHLLLEGLPGLGKDGIGEVTFGVIEPAISANSVHAGSAPE